MSPTPQQLGWHWKYSHWIRDSNSEYGDASYRSVNSVTEPLVWQSCGWKHQLPHWTDGCCPMFSKLVFRYVFSYVVRKDACCMCVSYHFRVWKHFNTKKRESCILKDGSHSVVIILTLWVPWLLWASLKVFDFFFNAITCMNQRDYLF